MFGKYFYPSVLIKTPNAIILNIKDVNDDINFIVYEQLPMSNDN